MEAPTSTNASATSASGFAGYHKIQDRCDPTALGEMVVMGGGVTDL